LNKYIASCKIFLASQVNKLKKNKNQSNIYQKEQSKKTKIDFKVKKKKNPSWVLSFGSAVTFDTNWLMWLN